MVVAANTTMTYLFMGWNRRNWAKAPFTVSHSGAVETEIAGVACHIITGIVSLCRRRYYCRNIGQWMLEQEASTLLIDLGTNGEMALGNRHRLHACATAAGPALKAGPTGASGGADMVRLLQKLLEEGLMDGQGLLKEPYFTKGVRIGDVLVTKEVRACSAAGKGSHCRRH